MLAKISAQEAHEKLTAGTARFIDIRTPEEFSQLSIEGSLLAPLSVINLQNTQGHTAEEVIFLCRSGNRTENANNTLQELYPNAYALDGGIVAWQKAGFPIRTSKTAVIPLERQVFITAGALVLTGVLGSLLWPPALFLAGFIGAGLIFAGVSGSCGLGMLLAKMPWNKK